MTRRANVAVSVRARDGAAQLTRSWDAERRMRAMMPALVTGYLIARPGEGDYWYLDGGWKAVDGALRWLRAEDEITDEAMKIAVEELGPERPGVKV